MVGVCRTACCFDGFVHDYIVLWGAIKVLFYNNDRMVTNEFMINPLEGRCGIHIPASQWHTLEVLESGTVIFEVKDGPYTPLGEEDVLR